MSNAEAKTVYPKNEFWKLKLLSNSTVSIFNNSYVVKIQYFRQETESRVSDQKSRRDSRLEKSLEVSNLVENPNCKSVDTIKPHHKIAKK